MKGMKKRHKEYRYMEEPGYRERLPHKKRIQASKRRLRGTSNKANGY